MLEENLLETLEYNLRRTIIAENRLAAHQVKVREKIEELKEEDRNLSMEIDTLDNSAKQTERAIISLLETLRKKSR